MDDYFEDEFVKSISTIIEGILESVSNPSNENSARTIMTEEHEETMKFEKDYFQEKESEENLISEDKASLCDAVNGFDGDTKELSLKVVAGTHSYKNINKTSISNSITSGVRVVCEEDESGRICSPATNVDDSEVDSSHRIDDNSNDVTNSGASILSSVESCQPNESASAISMETENNSTDGIDESSEDTVDSGASVTSTANPSKTGESDENSNFDDIAVKTDSGDGIKESSGEASDSDSSEKRQVSPQKFTKNDITEWDDLSNPMTVIVPLIGKPFMEGIGEIKPFTQRYDLAIERNRLKAEAEKGLFPALGMPYPEWVKIRNSRPKEVIERERRQKLRQAIKTGREVTGLAILILKELNKDEPKRIIIERCFKYFLYLPTSPTSLLYAPHFVHVVMMIRACDDFDKDMRRLANRCYNRCHCMFPIPPGYNFQTVFTSDCKKYVPEHLDRMLDIPLDYEGFHDEWSDEDDEEEDDDDSDYKTGSDKSNN